MEPKTAEELIRRLASALRGSELYSPAHPLVRRGLDAFTTATLEALQRGPTVVVGFIGDEIVVDDTRLPKGSASFVGFARALKDRDIEKITFSRGVTPEEVASFVLALNEKRSPIPLADRLTQRGVRHIAVGRI